ncbi:MAG: hypothetical protein ACUVQM_00840 [Candidatus Hadarchaeaceae archaeon]
MKGQAAGIESWRETVIVGASPRQHPSRSIDRRAKLGPSESYWRDRLRR